MNTYYSDTEYNNAKVNLKIGKKNCILLLHYIISLSILRPSRDLPLHFEYNFFMTF